MSTLQRLFLAACFASLVTLAPPPVAHACGWGPEDDVTAAVRDYVDHSYLPRGNVLVAQLDEASGRASAWVSAGRPYPVRLYVVDLERVNGTWHVTQIGDVTLPPAP